LEILHEFEFRTASVCSV